MKRKSYYCQWLQTIFDMNALSLKPGLLKTV